MNVPKIRINGFEGEWKRVKLAECLNISNETNKDNVYGKDDVLSVSDEIGVVNQIKHLGRSYAGKSVTNYGILKKGQIVYTKSPLKAKPFGIIKQNLGDSGIVSVLYAIYDAKEGVDAGYIHYYFDPAWRLNAYIRPLVNKGAKNTMNISDETALEGYIYLPPTLAEQQQIAEYFGQLDSLIEATGKKITSLKQTKQACLQQMFPTEGETTPRVRFKGFEGEWNNNMLGSLFSERCECDLNAEMLSVTQSQGVIKASDNGRYDNSNSDKSKYKLVRVNDIAYNSMRMWQGACGCSPYEGIVSPAYTVVTPKDDICSLFFYYMFKTNELLKIFRLNSQGLTSDTWNLKYPVFSKLRVYYPSSIEEQQQIASFFSNLDKQIRIQEQRLEKLKQIKAACLENMFV